MEDKLARLMLIIPIMASFIFLAAALIMAFSGVWPASGFFFLNQ